jgi:hypothetical protein
LFQLSAFRKLAEILEIVPKAAKEMYIYADFSCILSRENKGENWPIAGKESRIDILTRFLQHPSELVRGFKAISDIYFSLHQGQP